MIPWTNDSILLQAQPQIIKLLGINPGGCFAHHIDGAGGFGEGNDFPDACFACHQRDNAIVSERDAAVRRRAIFQGFEEKAETLACLFVAQAQNLEYLALDVWTMDTNRASANLEPFKTMS
jgi:hypothetical protein